MIEIEKAIVTWLRGFPALTSMTGHVGVGSSFSPHIMVFRPDRAIEVPALVLAPDGDTEPFVGETINRSAYSLEAYAATRPAANEILQYVIDLFTDKSTLERRLHGRSDITDLAVCVQSTRLGRTATVRQDPVLSHWSGYCNVVFRWYLLD